MTKSAKYIGREGYKLYKKYLRHLRWFGRKVARKIKLYDSDLVFNSPKIHPEDGSISILFPESYVATCLDPFPNKDDVLIRYNQDLDYIISVIQHVAMMKRYPRVEFITKKDTPIKGKVRRYYNIIIPFEAYQ